MNSRTHLLIAMLLGWFYFRLFPSLGFEEKFVFSLFLIIGALLPDIDDPQSTLGRKHKFVSYFTSHRGILHAIWVPAVAYLVAKVVILLRAPLLGLSIGYFSHLAADCLTIKGIAPFAPLAKFRIRWLIRTGSFVETLIAAAVVMFFLVQPF